MRREFKVGTLADQTVEINGFLKRESKRKSKIEVEGLTVEIADEAIFIMESTGQQLTLEQYRDYTPRKIIQVAPTRKTLRQIWINPEKRQHFLEELRRSDIHPEVFREILNQNEVDTYDLLPHLAFGAPIRTRSERTLAFRNREQAFLQRHSENAPQVVLAPLEKYRVGLRNCNRRCSAFPHSGSGMKLFAFKIGLVVRKGSPEP